MDNTLNKIQDLIRKGAESDVDKINPVINFDLLVIEARESWASMLFSNTGDQAITRYSIYQLRELHKCLLLLNTSAETCKEGFVCDTATLSDIKEKIFLLFDSFFEAFGDYIVETLICHPDYHNYICKSTIEDCRQIEEWLDKLLVDKAIHDIIKSYLIRLSDYVSYHFQYVELAFYQKFVRELKSHTSLSIEGDCTPLVIDSLINLNFNHLDLFNFQQQQLKAKFESLDLKTAVSVIRKELPKIPYQEKRNKLRLDYRWTQTGEMLYNWLSGELSSLEARLEADSKSLHNLQKLPFRLSVAHLACLIRLFAKEHVFGEIPLTEIFDFFGRNCSSKRQSVISAGGISKEFYSMSQVVAAEMRDILQRMINRINRDYFPVVVVMLLTIGFC